MGTKRQPQTDVEGRALVALGKRLDVQLTQADADLIFETIAPECKTQSERALYLRTCAEHGLNPLRKEIYATRRGGKLTFVVSYEVYMKRAQEAGWIVSGAAVCQGDDWGGFDEVAKRPLHHVRAPDGKQGRVLGAWARAVHRGMPGEPIGAYWPWDELKPKGDSPMWRDGGLPAYMAAKTAQERVARWAATGELGGTYAAEEIGFEPPTEEPRVVTPDEVIPPPASEDAPGSTNGGEQMSPDGAEPEGPEPAHPDMEEMASGDDQGSGSGSSEAKAGGDAGALVTRSQASQLWIVAARRAKEIAHREDLPPDEVLAFQKRFKAAVRERLAKAYGSDSATSVPAEHFDRLLEKVRVMEVKP